MFANLVPKEKGSVRQRSVHERSKGSQMIRFLQRRSTRSASWKAAQILVRREETRNIANHAWLPLPFPPHSSNPHISQMRSAIKVINRNSRNLLAGMLRSCRSWPSDPIMRASLVFNDVLLTGSLLVIHLSSLGRCHVLTSRMSHPWSPTLGNTLEPLLIWQY